MKPWLVHKRKWRQEIVISENIATMTLTNLETGRVETTIFDAYHVPIVEPFSWNPCKDNYLQGWADGKMVGLHRWLTKAPKGTQVDHINHLIWDNRDSNLRIVSSRMNNHNRSDQNELGSCLRYLANRVSVEVRVSFIGQHTYCPILHSIELATVVRDAFLVIARDVDAGLRLPPSREELVELTNRIKATADV